MSDEVTKLRSTLGHPGQPAVGLGLRRRPAGSAQDAYLQLHLQSLFHDIVDLTGAPDIYPLGRWYIVEITASGGHLQVFVDGVLKLEFIDREPLPEGGISFETTEGSRAMIDDVEVRAP